MESAEDYRISFKKHRCISLAQQNDTSVSFRGIVTHIGRNIIVLSREEDFRPDGIRVFPKSMVTHRRIGCFENCWDRIMRQNGAIRRMTMPKWLAGCNTVRDVITEVHQRGVWPIVEALVRKKSYFYIGPIARVGKDDFGLYCYDADGTWEKVYNLRYDHVLRITIGSRYAREFNRFMRRNNPPSIPEEQSTKVPAGAPSKRKGGVGRRGLR